jgi:hypothetical protein
VGQISQKSVGGFFPGAYATYPPMAFFFGGGFINQATAQTAEPIFTHDTSKEPVWAKEVPFGGQKFFQKFFDPKRGQKPPFPCISMGNKNVDNFSPGKPIFTKFGM